MTYRVPTEEQALAVESFQTFLRAEIRPVARDYRDRFIPKATMRELTQRIAEFGLPGCTVPVEHGGMGWSYTTQSMLFEELAACSWDIALCVMHNMTLVALLLDASPAVRERCLPLALSGRLFGSVGISEAGSDAGGEAGVAQIGMRAARNGNTVSVNGTTSWLANAPYADLLVCPVQMDEGIAHVLIDRERHGYEIRSVDRIAPSPHSMVQMFVADTLIPDDYLLGDEGGAGDALSRAIDLSRSHTATLAVGLMRTALDASLDFIGASDAQARVADPLAQMALDVEAARLMCLRVAGLMDASAPCTVEAAQASLFATHAALEVCRVALQVHGSDGFKRDLDAGRWLREAIVLPVVDGTNGVRPLVVASAFADKAKRT